MHFLDEALISVEGGGGGNGCLAFRREKFVPRGGPSGGDGGDGGSVLLVGSEGLNTLYHLRYRSLYRAERGRHGEGSNKTGRRGENNLLEVPLGTVIKDADSGDYVGEVVEHGQQLVVAQGGRGGRGNARFKTATNQAPRRADPGEEGEERRLRLELKLLADVGLVGLPNAGKSTLVSAISAARPKIADYPFTTLIPQLGVVAPAVDRATFVVADLPGLIEGAASGAGLGTQFLRHAERCRVLVHLVELTEVEASASVELATIEKELREFGQGLAERPRLIVGSKLDSADPERLADLEAAAAQRGLPFLTISSATREGLGDLVVWLERFLAEVEA